MRRYIYGAGFVSLAALVLIAGWWAGDVDARVQKDRCERADARLAETGRGDRDHDGISDCRERRTYGTDHKDWDTDDDGIADGRELAEGTDPLLADTDSDGLDDGAEARAGTNPLEMDTDADGDMDGDDRDPAGDLDDQIESRITALVCPEGGVDGELTILALPVVLTPETEYEGVGSCADLAALMELNGSVHAEVRVDGDAVGGLLAREVEVDDEDDDGSPDDESSEDGDSEDGESEDGESGDPESDDSASDDSGDGEGGDDESDVGSDDGEDTESGNDDEDSESGDEASEEGSDDDGDSESDAEVSGSGPA